MFFDLTKEIGLDEKNYRRYRRWQNGFYALCLVGMLYGAYLILFPTQEFSFSFLSQNKGSVLNPHSADDPVPDNGTFPAGKKITFDSSLVGIFSRINIAFTSNDNDALPTDDPIYLRKSYQAFLYPQGSPVGFKNGTLLSNQNNLYFISDGKLRRFASVQIVSALGFSLDAAIVAADNDLRYNPTGDEISDTKTYPADTLFQIDDDYYRLDTAGQLEKFISPNAFRSQYPEDLAIAKDAGFFDTYPLSEKQIGFADGSLLAYGTSVFVVSQDRSYPIGDPDIFTNQGYDWNDIITIGGDEMAYYTRQKLFTLTSAHPDGTIFLTSDTDQYYRIENGEKHLLPSKTIAASWLKKKPISVTAQSLEVLGNCQLRKKLFGDYACTINLDPSLSSPGQYYQFTFTPRSAFRIDNLDVLFSRNMTITNLKLSLKSMLARIKTRFGIQTAPPASS